MLCVVTSFGYYVFFEGCRGQTLGKALLGIEVVEDGTGAILGPKAAAMRVFLSMFVGGLAGVFLMLGSDERQRLGDTAANIVVVRKLRGSG